MEGGGGNKGTEAPMLGSLSAMKEHTVLGTKDCSWRTDKENILEYV